MGRAHHNRKSNARQIFSAPNLKHVNFFVFVVECLVCRTGSPPVTPHLVFEQTSCPGVSTHNKQNRAPSVGATYAWGRTRTVRAPLEPVAPLAASLVLKCATAKSTTAQPARITILAPTRPDCPNDNIVRISTNKISTSRISGRQKRVTYSQ